MIILLVCALPVIVLGLYIYLKDRDREPMSLLFKLIWKGILACLMVLILSGVFAIFIPLFTKDTSTMTNKEMIIYAFLCVALIEEACKYYFVYRETYDHKEFDTTFDMAVYASFVSLGFAFFENIEYLIRFGTSGDFFARYFTAVPLHLCTGIFMGIYLGDAALAQRKNIKDARTNKFFALIIPIMLHGFYDYTIIAGLNAVWIISFIMIVILSIVIVNVKRNHDVRIKYPNNRCPNCNERIVGVYCIKCGKKLF